MLGKNVIKKRRMYTTMSLIQKSLETVLVFNNRELDVKIIINRLRLLYGNYKEQL